jgi:sugar lactone lactonase YvrE
MGLMIDSARRVIDCHLTQETRVLNAIDCGEQYPSVPQLRQCLNDGKCDARGRVWVGSKVGRCRLTPG